MKHRNVLLALVAFITGIGASMVVPALAQQDNKNEAWEIVVTPYGELYIGVIKHNTATGQTRILTCSKTCDENKDAWMELPVKVVD